MSGRGEITTPRDNFKQNSNGWVDIVTVVIIWLYSFGVTVVIAIVYFVLNKVSWLDNLGRENRGKKDTKLENILGHLQKLAVEHEHDDKTGKSKFLLVEKAADEEDDI
jgi:H+-transporting ATPase